MLGTLAILGMPPFGVFASEFLILTTAMREQPWATPFLLLALGVAFASVFTKVQPMVFGETTRKRLPQPPALIPVFVHLALVLMLGLWTGAREACGQGLCGCCTVLVDGRAVSGCLYLACLVDRADVTTIEGFDASNQLSAEQEAFIEAGAFQCGYCTSGFIIMATQLLDEHPEPTDIQIKHYLSGNLCRCAAYPEIIAAVKLAARKRKARDATTARP